MIVDASVAIKWLIAEIDSPAAEPLADRTDLTAPSVLPIEVGYVLTKLTRRGEISAEGARNAWGVFRTTPLRIVELGPEVDHAFDLSLQLGASFYDCLYLSLAVILDDVMVTADHSFVRAVRASRDRATADRVRTLAELASDA